MSASNPSPVGTLDARFLRAVDAWCAGNGTSAAAFGVAVCGDRGFVAGLRKGRRPRLGTVDRALVVMGEPPVTPALLGEVEAFLAVTGTKRSVLGQEATGNSSFVAQLLRGVSPGLATVESVRAWMSASASAAERQEIRARTGAMPPFLTGATLPAPESRSPPQDRDSEPERQYGRDDVGRYMDTSEAADRLGLAPATLARYRITGAGPCHFRFGTCVRYRGEDLEGWAAERMDRLRTSVAAARQASP